MLLRWPAPHASSREATEKDRPTSTPEPHQKVGRACLCIPLKCIQWHPARHSAP